MRARFALPVLCLLLAATALPVLPVRAAPPSQVIDRGVFGVNSHIASRFPDPARLDVPAGAVARSGAGWAREEFQWHRIEPRPGEYTWQFFDQAVDQLRARGLNIIGVLNPAVGWATPFPGDTADQVSFYAPDPQRFAQFAAQVVARYRGRVNHWQIWNEPENALYWQPAPDPAAYAALLKASYPAIKAANPEARVLSAGVVPTHLDFLRALHANGAWDSFDILALHPYVDPFSPEAGQIGTGDLAAARALAESLGPKPIWATEFGWSAGPANRGSATDEELQASYLVRGAVLLRTAGVERILWYSLKDTELRDGAPFNLYGLMRYGGGLSDYDPAQQKPAFAAFRTLNEQLAGATPLGLQELGQRQILADFEAFGTWRRGNEPNGTFTQSDWQYRNGRFSARLDYTWPGAGNDYVVFAPRPALSIPGTPGQLGLWVFGDGSGHALKLWLRDAEGETLQFRLGFIGAAGWAFLSTPLTAPVEPYNRISGQGNLRLDFPIALTAVVLDDEPDSRSGSGTIFLDDLTAVSGPEAYLARFARGSGVVDVVWAPQGGQVAINTASSSVALIDRSGGTSSRSARDGQVLIDAGPSPRYLVHVPAGWVAPIEPGPGITATPAATPSPLPATPVPAAAPLPGGTTFSDQAFFELWARTDAPLALGAPGLTPRSWLWGPQPLTAGQREPFAEGPGGTRLVQYFDKSRMEINNPDAPRNQWYVTNGLLVVEMIEGRVQVGANAFETRQPADEAVAGDPAGANPGAPTYRSLRAVAFPATPTRAPRRAGEPVITTLSATGATGEDADLARYNVRYRGYDETLGHNIPDVFAEFFNGQGVVLEGGAYRRAALLDWVFVMGLPISEPYWARVRINGIEKDVLVQAFQRRVLTYTPDNPPEWRVEMGNVGQHYLRWRYGR